MKRAYKPHRKPRNSLPPLGGAWRDGETRHNCDLCAKPIRWAMRLCAVCWKTHRINEAYLR